MSGACMPWSGLEPKARAAEGCQGLLCCDKGVPPSPHPRKKWNQQEVSNGFEGEM